MTAIFMQLLQMQLAAPSFGYDPWQRYSLGRAVGKNNVGREAWVESYPLVIDS